MIIKIGSGQHGISAIEVIFGLLLIGGLAWKFYPPFSSEYADKKNAEMAVRASLKDPDSAQFGEFTITHTITFGKTTEVTACLTVNSKNSFGGYVGNQEAIVFKRSGGWILDRIIKSSHDSCIKKKQSECIELAATDEKYKMSCELHSNSN